MAAPELDELRLLRRARDRMDREFAHPLDVAALARTALMSQAHFSRRFREAYSETPYSYLMTRRIERAKALLRAGDLTVRDVCFAVGCTSLGSFTTKFTELVGESPAAYRARDHSDLLVVPSCRTMILTRPRKPPRAAPAAARPAVLGPTVDAQTRCVHYRGPLDVVAIRFACCGEYYPCHLCHEQTADHPAAVWPLAERDRRAVLCGVCDHELTIADYLASTSCPSCAAAFNPGCSLHTHLYFEV
ncbi:helix-turn-helix domain-containing protein [Herbiconiux sp. A18JL235]|uniref:Helix-turn-helix domain-containing protein n=1 Tax=Herbiconiux sp. A18JL235 TaxID=3152363 RepID=A0AB39BH46_9MICO